MSAYMYILQLNNDLILEFKDKGRKLNIVYAV